MWERWIPFVGPFVMIERRKGYISTATIPRPSEYVKNRSDIKEIKNGQGYQPRKGFHTYEK